MPISIGRLARVTALGTGLIAAAAIALSTTSASADTTDTGGSATITVPRSYVVGLAKQGVILLAGGPASASYTAGQGNASSTESCTFTVTGGNGEVANFYGTVQLGGTLVVINAAHSQTATITDLRLDFFNGTLTGVIDGASAPTAIAYISGSLTESTGTGTETFSASKLMLSGKAATALNAALGTKAFLRATDIGAFTTTFDVTIS